MIHHAFRKVVWQLRFRRHLLLPALVTGTGILVAAHFIVSCSGTSTVAAPPPVIPGAEFVGSESCATCHESITKVFPQSVHARIHPVPGMEGIDTSCESCHGPGSLHVEAGGGTPLQPLIVNPGKSPESCFKCHLDIHADFRLPHHHPVLEGQMNCANCHDPHGHEIFKPAGGPGLGWNDQSCAQCHREQSRKFVFEHEAMREGCTTCHVPHGSVNDKMLVQNDVNLCLKCHAQVAGAPGRVVIGRVDHSNFIQRGNCSTSGCHTAVHGSNINPKLLY